MPVRIAIPQPRGRSAGSRGGAATRSAAYAAGAMHRRRTCVDRSARRRVAAPSAVIVVSSARISGGPWATWSPTERSPLAKRSADAVSSRRGRVTDRAITHPISTTAANTTAAMAPSANQKLRIRWSTSAVSSVIRKAPCTVPPDATGTATYSRSVPRVSDRRVPEVRTPSSAASNSGRVEKSRLTSAAGVDLGDPCAVDHHDACARAVLVGVRRCRIERRAVFEIVLVERRDDVRVVFDVGREPLAFALGVEDAERHHQQHQHDHRDGQIAGEKSAGHGDVTPRGPRLARRPLRSR